MYIREVGARWMHKPGHVNIFSVVGVIVAGQWDENLHVHTHILGHSETLKEKRADCAA